MGIRVKVGFKDSVGVQSGQNGQGECKKNFRAPSAPRYVWPVAVDPWQLSGPGGQGWGGGGRVPEPRGRPPPCRHRGAAAVSVDGHSPSGRGEIQVPGGVCGAQMPGAPEQGAPLLLPRYGGNGAGGAQPGPAYPSQGAPWGPGPPGATRPGYRPPECAGPQGSARHLVP